MLKKIAVTSLMLSSLAVQAEEIKVKPNEMFAIAVASIHAPASEGWVLSNKSPISIQFKGSSKTNEGLLAQVNFFKSHGPYDKEGILSTVKKNVRDKAIESGGVFLNESYVYSEEKGYPCVKVQQSLKITSPIIVQQHILMCIIPKYENLGLMVAFSYPSKEPIAQFESDASAFLSGVKVNY